MSTMTRNENGGALPEGTATAVSVESAGSIRLSDSAEVSDERARRQVAAFLMTMFLDDLLASASIARQLEAGPIVCDIDAWEALPPC